MYFRDDQSSWIDKSEKYFKVKKKGIRTDITRILKIEIRRKNFADNLLRSGKAPNSFTNGESLP